MLGYASRLPSLDYKLYRPVESAISYALRTQAFYDQGKRKYSVVASRTGRTKSLNHTI